ncbi:MAG: hypothetical protein ACK56I_10005, partial [bacterium]
HANYDAKQFKQQESAQRPLHLGLQCTAHHTNKNTDSNLNKVAVKMTPNHDATQTAMAESNHTPYWLLNAGEKGQGGHVLDVKISNFFALANQSESLFKTNLLQEYQHNSGTYLS